MWQFTQDNKWGCAHGELLWNLMKFQFLGGELYFWKIKTIAMHGKIKF